MQDDPQDRRRQVDAPQADGREVPDMPGRGPAGAPLAPRDLLLLLALPEVRLRPEQPPRAPRVPEVPRALPPGEGDEARGTHRVLQQPGVRLPSADRPGSERRERLKASGLRAIGGLI